MVQSLLRLVGRILHFLQHTAVDTFPEEIHEEFVKKDKERPNTLHIKWH